MRAQQHHKLVVYDQILQQDNGNLDNSTILGVTTEVLLFPRTKETGPPFDSLLPVLSKEQSYPTPLTISKRTAAVTAIQCSLISKAALREKLPW